MFLKQSTAYTFRFGPFLHEDNGKAVVDDLTIEDSHIRVSKAGANFIDKNETTNAAHDEAGFYVVILNTTDTNTVGELQIACHMSGALPVFKTFQVVVVSAFRCGRAFSRSLGLIAYKAMCDTSPLSFRLIFAPSFSRRSPTRGWCI